MKILLSLHGSSVTQKKGAKAPEYDEFQFQFQLNIIPFLSKHFGSVAIIRDCFGKGELQNTAIESLSFSRIMLLLSNYLISPNMFRDVRDEFIF